MIAQSDTTQWPEAAIAIAGILLVIAVTVAVIWQVAATVRARARCSARRPTASSPRSRSRRSAASPTSSSARSPSSTSLGSRTSELERLIKTVE